MELNLEKLKSIVDKIKLINKKPTYQNFRYTKAVLPNGKIVEATAGWNNGDEESAQKNHNELAKELSTELCALHIILLVHLQYALFPFHRSGWL